MTNDYEKITDGFGKSLMVRGVPLHARYVSAPTKKEPHVEPPCAPKVLPKPIRTVSTKKARPDVRLAKCPLCSRRFGYVAAGEELLLDPNDFLSKLCDRHGNAVVT